MAPYLLKRGRNMLYDVDVLKLSPAFYVAYPVLQYPEIMGKQSRPYACLLVKVHDYFICIPYRTHIDHPNAYHFRRSRRSQRSKSGLDYSKMVIIQNSNYIESTPTVIDQDEYNETMIHLNTIVTEAVSYLDGYIDHIQGTKTLHPKEFLRKYGFSTLPYFHDVLGL